MPTKDCTQHHLPQGPARYLDIQFRQLRHESIEPIVDACYHGLQALVFAKEASPDHHRETPRGVRYSCFCNVESEELLFHERDGLMARLSYDCPFKLRGRAISKSGIFEEGKMVCLVARHEETEAVNVIMMEVFLRESSVSQLSSWIRAVV